MKQPTLSEFLLDIKLKEKIPEGARVNFKIRKGMKWFIFEKDGKWKFLYGRNKAVEVCIRRNFENAI